MSLSVPTSGKVESLSSGNPSLPAQLHRMIAVASAEAISHSFYGAMRFSRTKLWYARPVAITSPVRKIKV